MEIDAATRADADAIAATFASARRAAMPWLPRLHSEAEERRYFAEQVIGECDVLVVRRERRPVAFLALRDDLVEHLYVHPDAQRSGIGSALLEAAKLRRPAGLRLWVFQRNLAARAFYADHGFGEVELTDGAANEEREPDVLLEWSGRIGDGLPRRKGVGSAERADPGPSGSAGAASSASSRSQPWSSAWS